MYFGFSEGSNSIYLFIYLINMASPRTVGLIPLWVIPQERSCSDIPWGWNHRTSAQVWVSGRDETKLK